MTGLLLSAVRMTFIGFLHRLKVLEVALQRVEELRLAADALIPKQRTGNCRVTSIRSIILAPAAINHLRSP
jgi:hypothetical protein